MLEGAMVFFLFLWNSSQILELNWKGGLSRVGTEYLFSEKGAQRASKLSIGFIESESMRTES